MTFLDGKARSLASDKSRTFGVLEQIQNHQRYCGLLYRHHLANSLKEAGFQLRLTGDSLFEIGGIPDAVLKEFSRRREDIERLMEERGWQGAKSASLATEITRAGKEEHTLQTLQADWGVRAKHHQFDAHTFMMHRGEPIPSNHWLITLREKLSAFLRHEKSDNPVTMKDAAHACISVAIETLSQRTSVFTERALLAESLKHSLVHEHPISQASIISAIAEEKSQQNLYAARCKTTKETYLTTPWLLTLEAETIARIEQNKNIVKSIATLQEVNTFQKNKRSQLAYPMTPSQIEAMNVLLTTQDRYLAIQGYAGTAKTTMLAEARLLMEEKGYQLRGIAVASPAANELQTKSGIRSDVFPVVYQALKNASKRSLKNTIFIVDEASMLSSPQGHALLKHIERTEARLVLVGDKAQLPSVNNGRIFGLTQEYGIETVVMDDIVRQKNSLLKEAVVHATRGEINKALSKLDIQALSTHEERMQWMAERWLSMNPDERESILLFAPTHRDREAITHLIRDGLKEKAELQGEAWIQSILKAKPMEAIQQRFVAYYQKDDVIRFNQNIKRHGVQQNHYYRVGAMSPKHRRNNTLPLISDNGKTISFSLKSLPHYKTHTTAFERPIEVYQQKTLEMNVGDKLMWARNFKADGIRNGEQLTVENIQNDTVTLKSKDEIKTFHKNNPALQHIDYSYVLTNYKAQGKDAPYGIGLMESYHQFGATMKNFYVQISRAIHSMTVVTDNKEELEHAIRRNIDEKQAAMDRVSSRRLKCHENRFKDKDALSIQSVIDKKIKFEHQRRDLSNIQELDFQKPALPRVPIKELELNKG